MQDASPRVQMFAARALGRVHHAAAIPQLFELAAKHADRDEFVRHEVVLALAEINQRAAVLARRVDPTRAVRAVVLLTLRQWQADEISEFLHDADPALVTEAARAINDDPLPHLGAQLAALAPQVSQHSAPEALVRRVLNANLKLGDAASIRRVVQIASSSQTPLQLKAEALDELALWVSPPPRDRVNGYWRPMPARDSAIVKETLTPLVAELLTKREYTAAVG